MNNHIVPFFHSFRLFL